MNYYAKMNRYRGTKSKPIGCLLLALPAFLIVTIAAIVLWRFTGMWYPLAYAPLFTVLSAFIFMMWWHRSDDWRNISAMKRQLFLKGMVSFGLLLYPLGYQMHVVSASYERWFSPGKEDQAILDGTESKTEVEHAEGAEWGKHSLRTAAGNVLLMIGYGVYYGFQ
jgi:hypothetical protein